MRCSALLWMVKGPKNVAENCESKKGVYWALEEKLIVKGIKKIFSLQNSWTKDLVKGSKMQVKAHFFPPSNFCNSFIP